jgi:hypothetical protein
MHLSGAQACAGAFQTDSSSIPGTCGIDPPIRSLGKDGFRLALKSFASPAR